MMISGILSPDQDRALAEILRAREPGVRHLLTGHAGSGKTTLVQHLARTLAARDEKVVLAAPTHKAVSVLAKKLRATESGIECRTIHSLLELRPRPVGDRQVFERKKHAKPVMADVVVIDECSMLSADLMRHIRRHLPVSFVLFVGDPAQLPPVGEKESESFAIKSRSHLGTIVRQAAGNPILRAAAIIRESQGAAMDWSWLTTARAGDIGVFAPGAADAWMRKGFMSGDFAEDADAFRYLAWTNDRVAQINRRVRQWIYDGDTPTPFMAGERALARSPVFAEDGETPLIATNEEVTVLRIEPGTFQYSLKSMGDALGWSAAVPSWRLRVVKDNDERVDVEIPRSDPAWRKALARVADEAADATGRWLDFHAMKQRMGDLRPVYAMTVHTSQGSTFRTAFVDVPDIRRRMNANPLEAAQLFYVAVTRPSHRLVAVGGAT